MRLKQLFTDDDAVSPVIGVILMVAITVILAAVIGAFVLNFGDSQSSTPTISAEGEGDTSSVTFTIESASQQIEDGNLYVRGSGVDTGNNEVDPGTGPYGAGDQITIGSGNLQPGTLNLVWDNGDTSSTVTTIQIS